MNVAPNVPNTTYAAGEDSKKFLLSLGNRVLETVGVHDWVRVPALNGKDKNSAFQRAVQAALSNAQADGQQDPIIVGVLPFDNNAPSNLYVPQSYSWHHQEESRESSRAEASTPKVLSRTILPDEECFKRGVVQAIVNFDYSDVDKVVLSAVHDLQFSDIVDVDNVLARIHALNSQGYRFRAPLYDQGELIGVSPELLIHKNGSDIFSNPLAGSSRRHADTDEDKNSSFALQSSTKDLYEHSIVVNEISRLLNNYCLALDVPQKPSLLATAAMWHLSTEIRGQLIDPTISALQLACLLHPTPAVCGCPTDRAYKLIKYIEPFDRGPFTGIVGWCDDKGNGDWVIAIRCGLVTDKTMRLFAGAGIVAASRPEAEWLEIRAKLGTMLKACGISI